MGFPVTYTAEPSGEIAIASATPGICLPWSTHSLAPVVVLYATTSAISPLPTPGLSRSPATRTVDPSGLAAVASPTELRAGSKRAAHNRVPPVVPWTRAPSLLAAVAVPLVTACPPEIGAAAAVAVTVSTNPVIATVAAADSRDESLTTILLRDAAAGPGAGLPDPWAGMARNNLLFRNCSAGRAKRAGRPGRPPLTGGVTTC